jgi:hypothetical protein
MDWKNMFSALLGFSTVIFLNMPQSDALTRGGQNVYVPLFVIVLVSQIVLEILAKYQGKLCETIEGLFTALIAVLGYALYTTLSQGNFGSGFYSSSYSTAPMYSGPQYGQGRQSGGGLAMPQALMAGAVVAICLFIWKRWLKPKLGISFAMCPEDVKSVTTTTTTNVVVPGVPAAPTQPQQPQQPDTFVSY